VQYIKGEPPIQTPELDFMPEFPGFHSKGSFRVVTGEKDEWTVGELVEQGDL